MVDEFLRDVPKVQLHCHLEGTLRATTFLDLASRHGVALTYAGREAHAQSEYPVHNPSDASGVYRFEDFKGFLLTFAAVSRSLAEPADYARLAQEYVIDALAQNVAYAEVFVSPSVWRFFHPDIDVRACMREMRAQFDAVRDPLRVRFIVDLTRNFGVENAMQTAQQAADLQDLGVIGIGLGGDEARFPAEMFEGVYAFAQREGLRRVAHAGEASGPQSIRAAIDVLGVERIGHGVRAIEDPQLVELLAQRGTPLEICPTSNVRTGVCTDMQAHPLLALDASGCVVTIDADDPALFGTTITDEYAHVERLAGRDALVRFIRNAIGASFADAAQKAALYSRLEAYLNDVRA